VHAAGAAENQTLVSGVLRLVAGVESSRRRRLLEAGVEGSGSRRALVAADPSYVTVVMQTEGGLKYRVGGGGEGFGGCAGGKGCGGLAYSMPKGISRCRGVAYGFLDSICRAEPLSHHRKF
jgi:hypothetical protein